MLDDDTQVYHIIPHNYPPPLKLISIFNIFPFKLNFYVFLLLATLLSSSSHPEYRPRTIFGSQKCWHQLSTVMKDGKKKKKSRF